MNRTGPLLLALLLGCGPKKAVSPPPPPAPQLCNGHAELCGRRFDQVAFPATHNSMSNVEDNWGAPNQQWNMQRQLDEGIRALLIDTWPYDNDLYLCHEICEAGKLKLADGLKIIGDFLAVHPREVVSILFEDHIPASDTERALNDAGLVQHLYVHARGTPWPTLGELIDKDTRLVIFAENASPPPAWLHHLWDEAWDTPYTFRSTSEFSCAPNRGTKGNALFLVNHWLGNPLPDPQLAHTANAYDVLSPRVKQCQAEAGQLPNFVAVDFYNSGALFRVVDELNGFPAP